MNNLTRNLMTMVAAGSLLFGSIGFSSAQLSMVVSGQQSQNNTLNNLLNDPYGGDGEAEPTTCRKIGKIINLKAAPGQGKILIQSEPGTDRVLFLLDDPSKAHTHIQWDLLKEAWLRNLTVEVTSGDGPCELRFAHQYAGDYYDGGKISMADVRTNPTE